MKHFLTKFNKAKHNQIKPYYRPEIFLKVLGLKSIKWPTNFPLCPKKQCTFTSPEKVELNVIPKASMALFFQASNDKTMTYKLITNDDIQNYTLLLMLKMFGHSNSIKFHIVAWPAIKKTLLQNIGN